MFLFFYIMINCKFSQKLKKRDISAEYSVSLSCSYFLKNFREFSNIGLPTQNPIYVQFPIH